MQLYNRKLILNSSLPICALLSLLISFETAFGQPNFEYKNDDAILIKAADPEAVPINETEDLRSPPEYLKNDRLSKIVGGRYASLGEYPWMVSILAKGRHHTCGGSLIDSLNVLTAAHCLEKFSSADVSAMRVRFGSLNPLAINNATQFERRAKSVALHRGYKDENFAFTDDIAIIHLSEPVEFSETVQPVVLHNGSPPYDTGRVNAEVTGWGQIFTIGPLSSDLRVVTVRVLSPVECGLRYLVFNPFRITQQMVCATDLGRETCQGDSGGPLVINAKGTSRQIGIVSWGLGCLVFSYSVHEGRQIH